MLYCFLFMLSKLVLGRGLPWCGGNVQAFEAIEPSSNPGGRGGGTSFYLALPPVLGMKVKTYSWLI